MHPRRVQRAQHAALGWSRALLSLSLSLWASVAREQPLEGEGPRAVAKADRDGDLYWSSQGQLGVGGERFPGVFQGIPVRD